MVDAAYYRAQAQLCFSIARSLSDPVAAERTRNTANEYVRRAQELENSNNEPFDRNE